MRAVRGAAYWLTRARRLETRDERRACRAKGSHAFTQLIRGAERRRQPKLIGDAG